MIDSFKIINLNEDFTINEANSKKDYFDIVHIRHDVFCNEQKVPLSVEDDPLDGEDTTHHFIIRYQGKPAGTLSYVEEENNIYRMRRFALKEEYRGMHISKKIFLYVERVISKNKPCKIYFHAQYYLYDYYLSIGYKPFGEIFYEGGIKHIGMEKRI